MRPIDRALAAAWQNGRMGTEGQYGEEVVNEMRTQATCHGGGHLIIKEGRSEETGESGHSRVADWQIADVRQNLEDPGGPSTEKVSDVTLPIRSWSKYMATARPQR
jgi:hypothetical protein